MPTFTFITDYRGGTYICQKSAADLRTACLLWKEDVASGEYVQHLDVRAFVKAFDADIDELPPLPINEVSNVWIFHLLFGRYMLDLHIIQTDLSRVSATTTPKISRALS